jgi:hypothetical protein
VDIIAIINAVPEPLATGIITATFTGLLLFYFKTRIENSFAEKLEQFKAQLQKSSTEHQIKYSKTFPKTLETLETIHQKFINLRQLLVELPYDLSDEELAAKEPEVKSVINDFYSYLVYNRLHLPDEIAKEIVEIADRMYELSFILMTCRKYSRLSVTDYAIFLSALGKFENLGLGKIDPDGIVAEAKYIRLGEEELGKYAQQLEHIYKLVAEPQK